MNENKIIYLVQGSLANIQKFAHLQSESLSEYLFLQNGSKTGSKRVREKCGIV
jgi:hypothetical protein